MHTLSKIFIFILSIAILNTARAQDGQEDGFSLVKEDKTEEIFIYERWISFPKSQPPVRAREVKGEFFAQAELNNAAALLKDESQIKQWQSHVSKFKVYPQTDSTWFEYSYHDIPWPVSDQDHFLEYKIERQNDDEVFITFESIINTKLGPVDDDASRMQLAGSWRFEKQKDQIKITYRILSMPSSIPRIFTDPVIRSNMMSTIKSYIKILEDKKK